MGIAGLGTYVPERILGNAELETLVDTTDEWIRTRTGIEQRHLVSKGQATSDLAIEAGRRALADAEFSAEEVELIVVATATPDHPTPPTACLVQHGLGARRAAGFDLNAACSGFINALMTGHQLVAGGAFQNALVIGADALSTVTDYQDRETCVLFGDGAGAVLLRQGADPHEVLDHVVGVDGAGADLIKIPAGGSRIPASHDSIEQRGHYLAMNGRAVFRFAVDKVCELAHQMSLRNGISIDDIDLFVLHQANRRILDAATRSLGIDASRVMDNIKLYGNTSNASIPMALAEAQLQGRIRQGDYVLLIAFGGGLTWGASLIRW